MSSEECDKMLMPPIPFSHQSVQLTSRLLPPLSPSNGDRNMRHILGTDGLGRDVAAGMLFGLKQAIVIGFGSMTLALLFGYLLGVVSAWFGDHRVRMTTFGLWSRLVLSAIAIVCLIYFSIQLKDSLVSMLSLWPAAALIGTILFVLFWMIRFWEGQQPISQYRTSMPVDSMIIRLVEIFQSVPALLLLIGLTAAFKSHSVWSLVLIIFLIRWTAVARFVRARVMILREKAFLENAYHLRMPFRRVLFIEILPHTYDILVALFSFGVSTAILLEATLTFLGLGLPLEQVSWGGLIRDGRQHPGAWWLVVFPGLAISLTLLALILIGEEIQRHYSSESKNPKVL